MRPLLFLISFFLLSACAVVVPSTYTKENTSRPSVEVEDLVDHLGQIKIVDHLGEKLIVQTIPYTWPVLVDRVYLHYVLEKEPGVKRLKYLFSKYRKKYKEEKCFFVQITHPLASVVNHENWRPELYAADKKLGATFQLFLANRPNSFANVFDKNGDHPILGDKKPVTNVDVCSSDLKEFAGEIKLVIAPVKDQGVLPFVFNWNFAR